jgi:hypothetical protein
MTLTKHSSRQVQGHHHNVYLPDGSSTITDGTTTLAPTEITFPIIQVSDGRANVPMAPMLVKAGGVALPTFISDTDPMTIPELAAFVIPGAVWIDRTWGPPYEQDYWDASDPEHPMWLPLGSTVYNKDLDGSQVSAAFPLHSQFLIYAADPDGTNETYFAVLPGGLVTINDLPIGTQAADVPAAAGEAVTAAEFNALLAALRASQEVAQTGVALAFAQDPTAALVGAVIAPAVTVNVLDDLGNICTHDNSTSVTVALTTPGGATLGGTLTVTAVAGVATFDDLIVDTAGTYTLTATGLTTPDESASFVVSAP